MNGKNILKQIIDIKDSLPKKQKKVCDYLLENYDKIGLFSIRELANEIGVGTTTISRVRKQLNYNTFSDLKVALHNVSLRSSKKYKKYVTDTFDHESTSKELDTLNRVWNETLILIEETLTQSFFENFSKAMNYIENASKINILGLRLYKPVAIYLEFLIEEFYSKTRQLSYDSDSIFDKIIQFEQDEILILFAFESYVTRVVEAAKVAHDRGITIILITDHLSCPIVPQAKAVLKVGNIENSFSIVPVIPLVEAISIELGRRHADVAIKNMYNLVDILKAKNIIME